MMKKFLEKQIARGEEFVWIGQQPDKYKDVAVLPNFCRIVYKFLYQ
jgi:hypothetical protein